MDDSESVDLVKGGEVSANVLMDELLMTIEMGAGWADRCRLAEDTSWCIWPGQSDDGLKHAWPGDDEPPFPWESASDTRIRLVEEKVREHCRIEILTAKRGNWSFQGINETDFLQARRNVQLLRWQEARQIPMARRERNLWIYWAALYGCSIMGLGWKDDEQLGLRKVRVEQIIEYFMQQTEDPEEQDAYVETFKYLLSNPDEASDWLESWLAEFFPEATSARLRQAAKELAETGEADLPQLRKVANHPTWQALRPLEHVFFPQETESMRTARWVGVRQWLTRGEVESYRDTWGDDAVDELLRHEGLSTTQGLEDYHGSQVYGKRRWGGHRRSVFSEAFDRRGLYEVFWFYHRSVDEDGIEGIYKSCISSHVRDQDGYKLLEQEIYDDGTGALPFEEKTYFDNRRALMECEGIPALLYTYQQEKKGQRDARFDVSKISVLPPIRRHMRDKNIPLVLGPDMPIYESVPGSTQWMDPPKNQTSQAVNLEQQIDAEANRLTGMPHRDVPEVITQVNQEVVADHFAEAYGRVLMHTFQLDQCYLDETVVTRVSGSVGGPFKVSREEIQGQFDLMLTFDPRELDMDYAMKKFEAVTRIATELDKNAITETNNLVKMGYGIVAPDWVDMLVTDENTSSQKEIRAAKDAVNDIIGGQMPDLDASMNAQLRGQYLQQQLQENPVLLQIAQSEEDPRRAMLEKYDQHVKHIYHQQYVAPAEGRAGVKLGADY
jgi:hypothetical protein